ncbi:membrane protein [Staphylococcus petrasii]|uniref:Membrane protein n=1 Tax=Staphylococcus petrasii TaxID=1276936 RepID=A0A380FWZ6_9STAP|nr:hypothetical protein [Staphylococcus petrasii]PNZ27642.1 hypothetical protein CD137_08415 [Staphylococcus petrasii]TGE13554.1 hypothetical protein E2557_00240 [Staphylococcus petrasii]TGE16737.1 hypothetical protein BJR09_08520 [Staphylococcus petrasii]SUM43042.1 membrane protein [Staphylococcus petrasii]
MKRLSYIIGFLITVLGLYNILRFGFSLVENHFNLNFGIDILLHNNYVIYGTMIVLIVLTIAETFVEQYLEDRNDLS